MKTIATKLDNVIIIEPEVFGDSRGFFLETWNKKQYEQIGIKESFLQDNVSYSQRGVLRGLHFQNPNQQGKLVYVLQGEVFDVVVDIRKGSQTFGNWIGATLSSENKRQVYVPPGFAHGFCVTSATAMFAYKCTDFYNPDAEHSILWSDPEIGVNWPIANPDLSSKDQKALVLNDIDKSCLPQLNE